MSTVDPMAKDAQSEALSQNIAPRVGSLVHKVSGYPFPGEVRCVFRTRRGKLRYVVEATGREYAGMLHIFSPEQIALMPNGGVDAI